MGVWNRERRQLVKCWGWGRPSIGQFHNTTRRQCLDEFDDNWSSVVDNIAALLVVSTDVSDADGEDDG